MVLCRIDCSRARYLRKGSLMIYVVRNFEKFLEDHPEIPQDEATKIITHAKGLVCHGRIYGDFVGSILGRRAITFILETKRSIPHMVITAQVIQGYERSVERKTTQV